MLDDYIELLNIQEVEMKRNEELQKRKKTKFTERKTKHKVTKC